MSKAFDPNFPFSPARVPFFYGWIIFLSSFCGHIVSVFGRSCGVTPFTEPLLNLFQISRVHYSSILTYATLLGILVFPFLGHLLDRIRVRRSITYLSILMGLNLLFLGMSDKIIDMFRNFTSPLMAITCTLFIGFFLLKLLGQNLIPLVSRIMLLHWFDCKNCMINGVIGVFITLMMGATPQCLQMLIGQFGILETWTISGVMVLMLLTPMLWFFCRDCPESNDVLIQNEPTQQKTRPESLIKNNQKPRWILKTFDFWIFIIAISVATFTTTGLQIHIVDIFRETNACTNNPMGILFLEAIVGAISGPILGLILDQFSIRYGLLMVFSVNIFIACSTEYVSKPLGLALFIIFRGINLSLYGILLASSWLKLFGKKHLGWIMSIASSITMVFAAIAPYVFAKARENFGSYLLATRTIFAVSSLGFLVSLIYMYKLKPRTVKHC